MNDHRDPQWPTGDDPDAGRRGRRQEQSGESTGFWKPSFDDDAPAKPEWPTETPPERPTTQHPRPPMGRHGSPPPGGPPRPPGRPGPGGPRQGPPGARPPGPGQAGQQTVVVRQPTGNPTEQPTDMLTPLQGRGRVAPEPELLTHREFDDEGYAYDDPDSQYDEPLESDEDARRRRRKKVWRRVRRSSYVFMALMIIAPLVAFFVAYQVVEVPDPKTVAAQLDKTVTVNWGDGSNFTTIAPEGRRTLVTKDQIPDHVKRAIFAAEDNTFESNNGFDVSGIMRAVWNNVTGGGGGGSTITQQYVKKATGDEQKTLTRKFMELATAYKMSNTMDKDDIITAYLNTIFFGKRAYGIAAAAKVYYNKDKLEDLTPEEAATLAGVIQQPGRAGGDPDWVQDRWNYVMDKMVEQGWYDAAKRKAAQYPVPVEVAATNSKVTPDMQLIWEQAKRELDAQGISEETLSKKGYTVELTIDKTAQEQAKNAIDTVMAGQPQNLRQALVAVDPATGRVVAYYGYNAAKNGFDYARAWQNPGSSFKPFDLVALLHKGKGLGEVYDGTTPRMFGPNCKENPKNCSVINNSENSDKCGKQCTVAKAMELSINTVFADIAYNEVTTRKVAEAAIQAGIPKNVGAKGIPLEGTTTQPDLNIAIGGGDYQARPINMAGAYATFAANGTKRTPHIVAKVTDPNDNNKIVVDFDSMNAGGELAFSKDDPEENSKIARNVTESLIPVVANNTKLKCADGRVCAGKTGTHGCAEVPGKTQKSDNCAAWMVGYTPQISSAVWVGTDDNTPVRNKQRAAVFGSGLSGEIWKKFMDSYLKGKEKEQFTKYVAIGKSAQDAVITNTNPQTNRPKPEDPDDKPTPTRTTVPRPTLTLPGGGGGDPGDGDEFSPGR